MWEMTEECGLSLALLAPIVLVFGDDAVVYMRRRLSVHVFVSVWCVSRSENATDRVEILPQSVCGYTLFVNQGKAEKRLCHVAALKGRVRPSPSSSLSWERTFFIVLLLPERALLMLWFSFVALLAR